MKSKSEQIQPASQLTTMMTLSELVSRGTMTEEQKVVLFEAIKRPMLIVGETAYGKTTLMRALLAELVATTPDVRLATVEYTEELQMPTAIRFAVPFGQGAAVFIKAATRIHLIESICVGEVMEGDGLALVNAWFCVAGVACMFGTSILDGLQRLNAFCIREGAIGSSMARIATAVNTVVLMGRSPYGQPVIKEIAVLKGFDDETGSAILDRVF